MRCSQCGVEYTNPSTSGSGVCSGCSIGKRGHSFFNIQKVIEYTDRTTIKELGSTRNTMTKQIPVEEMDWEKEFKSLYPISFLGDGRDRFTKKRIKCLTDFIREAISTAVKEAYERGLDDVMKIVARDHESGTHDRCKIDFCQMCHDIRELKTTK